MSDLCRALLGSVFSLFSIYLHIPPQEELSSVGDWALLSHLLFSCAFRLLILDPYFQSLVDWGIFWPDLPLQSAGSR